MNEKRIFWSEQGECACEEHAPYRGSDTWRSERWNEITPDALVEIRREEGGTVPEWMKCETCGARPASIIAAVK